MGVPHNRLTTYLVGWRADASHRAFEVPAQPAPQLELAITDLLSARRPSDNPHARPAAPVASIIVGKAAARVAALEPAQRPVDWMFNQTQSINFAAGCRPRAIWPSLTHSNTVGYWIGSRSRPATTEDKVRSQGLLASRVDWGPLSVADRFGLLVNSMCCAVIQVLVGDIQTQLGLPAGTNHWRTGEAQRRLRHEAAQAAPTGTRRQLTLKETLAAGATRRSSSAAAAHTAAPRRVQDSNQAEAAASSSAPSGSAVPALPQSAVPPTAD